MPTDRTNVNETAGNSAEWKPDTFLNIRKSPLNPFRYFRARLSSIPGIFLVTLPKSASAYIWEQLWKNLPAAPARVHLGHFPYELIDPHRCRWLGKGGAVVQSHVGPFRHNLVALEYSGVRKLLVHVRDPRQALISWTHHLINRNAVNSPELSGQDFMPPVELVQQNLGDILAWNIEHYLPLEVQWIEDWLEVEAGDRRFEVLITTYEEFKSDESAFFRKIGEFYGIPDLNIKPRKPEEGKLHYRKGATKEWMEVFTPEQIARANDIIPGRLFERFGWDR